MAYCIELGLHCYYWMPHVPVHLIRLHSIVCVCSFLNEDAVFLVEPELSYIEVGGRCGVCLQAPFHPHWPAQHLVSTTRAQTLLGVARMSAPVVQAKVDAMVALRQELLRTNVQVGNRGDKILFPRVPVLGINCPRAAQRQPSDN